MVNRKNRKTKQNKIKRRKTKKNKRNKTKKYFKRGGGYNTLKTGEKYSTNKNESEILSECFLSDPKLLNAIFPPFEDDNEIYIWINNRCQKDYSSIIEKNNENANVKIKTVLLPSIWGHCSFSFNPTDGPIYGYSVNVDELYEKYVSKTIPHLDNEYIDANGYLNFDTEEDFYKLAKEFEDKSYYGNGEDIQMFPAVLHDDTEIYKAIYNQPGCEIHRFTLFTQNKTNEGDIIDYITTNNGFVENSFYGIYKQNEKCYGLFNDKNIFNCITYITNKFKPYFYEKKYIGNKCIFSKTEMDTLGKYCGSLGMMIEKLKTTVGAEMYTLDTAKENLPLCLGGEKSNSS
jgi:hypothetical protein